MSNPLKVLIFGHSYVRDLKDFDIHISRRGIEVVYEYFPGASFNTFIRDPSLIERAVTCHPDLVIVILGGNSIKDSIPKPSLFKICREFYATLRN